MDTEPSKGTIDANRSVLRSFSGIKFKDFTCTLVYDVSDIIRTKGML